MPMFDYYGNYIHNDSSINLANSDVNCVLQFVGGRDDRPGKPSGGSDDEYSKTVISRVGFDPWL